MSSIFSIIALILYIFPASHCFDELTPPNPTSNLRVSFGPNLSPVLYNISINISTNVNTSITGNNQLREVKSSEKTTIQEQKKDPIRNQTLTMNRINPILLEFKTLKNINLTFDEFIKKTKQDAEKSILNQSLSEVQKAANLIPFRSLFEKFLQPKELQSIILTADYLPLVKSIQQILQQSQLSCEQKSSALSDFYGRIQTGIAIKKTQNKRSVDNRSVINQKLQIIGQEISYQNSAINNLQRQSANNKYYQTTKILFQSLKALNRVIKQSEQVRAQIQVIDNNITTLLQNSIQTYQQIQGLTLRLIQLNFSILIMKQTQFQIDRQIIQQDVSKLQQNIQMFNRQIPGLQTKKLGAQVRVQQLSREAGQLELRYRALQNNTQVQKQNYVQVQKRQRDYKDRLEELRQNYSNLQKSLINSYNSYDNEQVGKNLVKILPSIQQSIDQQNYKCNGIKKPQLYQFNNEFFYIISPREIVPYLKSVYNVSETIYSFPPSKIQLYSITIQDKTWQLNFGNSYNSQELAKVQDLYYKEEFNCLQPIKLEGGQGIIVNIITPKQMTIENEGKIIRLVLGACTRIQTINKLPKIGRKIYFRGVKIAEGSYNLYKATCL